MRNALPYIILLICICIIAFIQPKNKETRLIKYCHIDSVSAKQANQVLPSVIYLYHTPCGTFPANGNMKEKGDSIEVETIIVK